VGFIDYDGGDMHIQSSHACSRQGEDAAKATPGARLPSYFQTR